MSRIVLYFAALISLCLAGLVQSATLIAPQVISPDASGTTSVTLAVRWATISVDGAGTFSSRLYHVNGLPMYPGPTIQVQPGGTLSITLVNNLGPNDAADSSRAMNTFRHINTTNIHTHGLHADPSIDSIFRQANPGQSLTYNIPIIAAHHPGMHWYHAHTHGASTLQLMGGLFGALVVLPPLGVSIPTQVSSLTEEMFVMSTLKFVSEVTQDCDGRGSTNFDPFKQYSFSELETATGSTVHAAGTITTDLLVVNGMYQPVINMAPGQRKVLRTVFAAGAAHPALVIRPPTCTMTLVAVDGVYLDTPRTVTRVSYMPASRYDIVVYCPTAGTFAIENTERGFGGTVASIVVSGSATTTSDVPSSLTSITKPYYLQDQTSGTPTAFHQVHFTQGGSPNCVFWMGEGTDCSSGVPSSTCSFNSFAGERGVSNAALYSHVTQVGVLNEFTVYGLGNEPHPMHIHVNHFQVVAYTPNTGGQALADYSMVLGEWRDTIPALDGVFRIRFVANTYAGETVMHCHVLTHEDKGLMSTFLIQPGTGTPSAPVTASPPSSGSPATNAPVRATSAAATGSMFIVSALISILLVIFV